MYLYKNTQLANVGDFAAHFPELNSCLIATLHSKTDHFQQHYQYHRTKALSPR